MLIERASHPQFVSNTYLVADGAGGPAVFIDAGGPVEPLIAAAERLRIDPTHVLLTHHHYDHVCEVATLRERWPKLKVLIHPLERRGAVRDRGGQPGGGGDAAVRRAGGAPAAHARAHRRDALVSRQRAERAAARRPSVQRRPGGFTGERRSCSPATRCSRDSVGGVRAPGHTTYTDLQDSIMGTLMELPPRHGDPSGSRRGDDRRSRVGAQPVHPRLARHRPGGRRAVHRARRARDAGAALRATRRRHQGLGALARRHRTTSCRGPGSSRAGPGVAGVACLPAPLRPYGTASARPEGSRRAPRMLGMARARATRRSRPRACAARRPSASSPRARPSSSSARAQRTSRAARRPPTRRWPNASWRPPSRSWRRWGR